MNVRANEELERDARFTIAVTAWIALCLFLYVWLVILCSSTVSRFAADLWTH